MINEIDSSVESEEVTQDRQIPQPQLPPNTQGLSGSFRQRLLNQDLATSSGLTYEFAFQPLYSGTLEKKTRNLKFKPKFFVLTPYRLLYYEDSTCQQLTGCFNIIVLQSAGLTRSGLKITLNYHKVDIVLKASSYTDAELWYLHLRKAVDLCSKQGSLKVSINTNQKFWKEIQISSDELECYAQSLDIVLFKCSHLGASLQRLITVSDYDHVGITLRNDCGELFLLHSTSSMGVNIVRWSKFSQHGMDKLFEKVGFRKLVMNRPRQMMEAVEQYVESIVGNKYQISMSKIFRPKNKQTEQQKDKTFFCSQLVADIYKKVGILPSNKPASSYWPKHFTKYMHLDKGQLSHLMTLQLS